MDGEASSQDKVWNCQDLKNLSLDWNLKGDRILLQILENVHKDVLSKATYTREKLDVLSSDLSRASISLMNVNNKFISLSNTQFIENKVQEDDIVDVNGLEDANDADSAAKKSETSAKQIKANEDLQVDILNTVSRSLDVLEGLCEKIHISSDTDSGSDDSDSNLVSNVILRPHDIYADKPLPYTIGSQKWHKKWHIGLEECSSDDSDSENEKSNKKEDEEEYSSSDESVESSLPKETIDNLSNKKNQMTLPIQNRHTVENPSSVTSTSTTNSTDMADSEVAKINNVQHSIIKNTQHSSAHNDDETSNNHNKPAPQTLVKASDFAAELAKKLSGNVSEQPPVTTIPSNKKVEQKKDKIAPISTLTKEPPTRVTGNIFLDEPPPLEPQPKERNTFFSDDENNEDDVSAGLFGDEPSPNFHSSSRNDLFNAPGIFKNKQTSNYGGLFDDLPNDDVDNVKTNKKPVKVEKKVTSLFDDVDSDDNMDLFNSKSSNKTTKNVDKPIEDKSKKPPQLENRKRVPEKTQSKSLFDDFANSDDDVLLFGSSNLTSKSETPSNFQSNKNVKSSASKLSLSKSLFDDLSDSDDDLFASNKVSKIQITPRVKQKQNIAVEVKPKIEQPVEVKPKVEQPVEVERDSPKIIKSKPESPPKIVSKPSSKIEVKTAIIQKEISNESIFVNKQLPNNIDEKRENIAESENKHESNVIVNSGVNITSGLFDDIPPPLDDDISDIKESKKVFDDYDDDDLFGNNMNFNKGGSINRSDALFPPTDDDFLQTDKNVNLFSDEPPDYGEIKNDNLPSIESQNNPVKSNITDSNTSKYHDDLFETTTETSAKAAKSYSKSKLPPKPTVEKVNIPIFSDSEDDLFSTNSKIKDNKVKPSQLFTDSDNDDLFSTVSKTSVSNLIKTDITNVPKLTKPQTKDQNMIGSQLDNTERSTTDGNALVKKSSDSISSSPNKNPIFKQVGVKIERRNSENPLPVKPINKIQNNVNINVRALMPSNIPKSVKEIKNITDGVSIKTSDKSNVDFNNEPKSLDSTLCNDILKDRVKIKVKRRPSSRRARHEAVRKSAADIYNFPDEIEQTDNGNECTLSLPNSPEKQVKSDITINKGNKIEKLKGDNIAENHTSTSTKPAEFINKGATRQKLENVNVTNKISQEEKDVQSMPNLFNDNADLFGKDKPLDFSDDDLFSAKSSMKPIAKTEKTKNPIVKTNTKGLFSDSDSESDLFAPKENKIITKGLPTNVNKAAAEIKKPASIFDDVDGDDLFFVPNKNNQNKKALSSEKSIFGDDGSDDEFDIFKTQSSQQGKSQSKLPNTQTIDKPSSSKQSGTSKIKTTEKKVSSSFQDPLSMFLDG